MNIITGVQIAKAFEETLRVYLCGKLERPQKELECIVEDKLEIGSSFYHEFTADKPHFHARATEYNYIIQGAVKIFLINENKEYILEKGSMFVLQPNTPYATKSQAKTHILFIKCPGGNDKNLVTVDNRLAQWLASWDTTKSSE